MSVIRLRKLLQEFEVGNLLWADSSDTRRSGYFQKFLNTVYGDEIEPNTPEEAAALERIESFILNNDIKTPSGVRTLNEPKKFIKDLLKLKPKFPAMLDPLYNNPKLSNDAYIYRGMTTELSIIIHTIQYAKSFERIRAQNDNHYISVKHPKVSIKSRAKGFMSFTTGSQKLSGLAVADIFTGQNLWSASGAGRWGVIIGIRYGDIADKALLNPEFVEAIGGWGESEIWLLEGKIVPDVLYIRDPFIWYGTDSRATVPNEIKNALKANPNFQHMTDVV